MPSSVPFHDLAEARRILARLVLRDPAYEPVFARIEQEYRGAKSAGRTDIAQAARAALMEGV